MCGVCGMHSTYMYGNVNKYFFHALGACLTIWCARCYTCMYSHWHVSMHTSVYATRWYAWQISMHGNMYAYAWVTVLWFCWEKQNNFWEYSDCQLPQPVITMQSKAYLLMYGVHITYVYIRGYGLYVSIRAYRISRIISRSLCSFLSISVARACRSKFDTTGDQSCCLYRTAALM